jgi:NMD protein affecting ribosome stability and mRNA decay
MSARGRIYVRRGVESHLEDPYLLRAGYKEPTICPVCGLIYHDKRWIDDSEISKKYSEDVKVSRQKCPACRKIEDHYPMGLVSLSGAFLEEHKEDILNLVRNEEKRGQNKNPLERIMNIEEVPDGLEIETTTESLALRIGRIMNRAYSGEIHYKFSDGEKLVRILWHRD